MVNMNKFRDPAVYALHAGDHRYFYVGVTAMNSTNRLWAHKARARSGHPAPVYAEMRDLGIENIRVFDLELIKHPERPDQIEASWILRLIQEGHPIANERARDGIPNSMSDAAKARVGKGNAGRPTWIKGKRGEDAGWTDERREQLAQRFAEKRANRIPKHGTKNEYQAYGCRCAECRAVATNPRQSVTEHGRYLYKRDKCRCVICVEANRVYGRAWAAVRRASLLATVTT